MKVENFKRRTQKDKKQESWTESIISDLCNMTRATERRKESDDNIEELVRKREEIDIIIKAR